MSHVLGAHLVLVGSDFLSKELTVSVDFVSLFGMLPAFYDCGDNFVSPAHHLYLLYDILYLYSFPLIFSEGLVCVVPCLN